MGSIIMIKPSGDLIFGYTRRFLRETDIAVSMGRDIHWICPEAERVISNYPLEVAITEDLIEAMITARARVAFWIYSACSCPRDNFRSVYPHGTDRCLIWTADVNALPLGIRSQTPLGHIDDFDMSRDDWYEIDHDLGAAELCLWVKALVLLSRGAKEPTKFGGGQHA